MTEQEKKRKLQGYAFLLAHQKNLELEIEELRQKYASASVNIGDGMPHSHDAGDLSDYVVKLERLMEKLNKSKADCVKAREAIENAIVGLTDPKERTLMYLRYVRCLQWDDVALELKYEIRQIFRIHGAALMHITFKDKDVI